MKLKALFLCAALASSTAAHAEFVNGDLLRAALASDKEIAKQQATGYIVGVFDATRGNAHCAPTSVTVSELVAMTTQMLEEVGALRSHTADVLIGSMLKLRYPCEAGKPSGGTVQRGASRDT